MKRIAEMAAGIAAMPETIGKKLDGMGGILRCNRCRRSVPMKGAAEYLRRGWPKCCGETMEWVSG